MAAPQEMNRDTYTRKTANGSKHAANGSDGTVQWNTPAYQILKDNGLLDSSYRITSSEESAH